MVWFSRFADSAESLSHWGVSHSAAATTQAGFCGIAARKVRKLALFCMGMKTANTCSSTETEVTLFKFSNTSLIPNWIFPYSHVYADSHLASYSHLGKSLNLKLFGAHFPVSWRRTFVLTDGWGCFIYHLRASLLHCKQHATHPVFYCLPNSLRLRLLDFTDCFVATDLA